MKCPKCLIPLQPNNGFLICLQCEHSIPENNFELNSEYYYG